ncbi:MAG: CDP-diacylglycerol O-phosphatidyltransferase [Acidobacteria bacterium]|nr:CDP-diacylglycerol O-phosphatidyltransferase [Acidobacteriota bacterium]
MTFLAWLVHLYTASGAVWAFLALRASMDAEYRAAFWWLAVAMVVDATDGSLARRARVNERLPLFDGARLDDIVDYLTFVLVPIAMLVESATLPSRVAIPVACFALLASGYGFGRTDAKTADHFFTGFPSYWNIVAFYLIAAGLPRGLNAAIVMFLSAMVFVPIGYIYPSRMPVLRSVTIGLGALWGGIVMALLVDYPNVDGRLLLVSLFYPAYYTALSFVLHTRRRRALTR